jgi:LSD1 subclass zinc finger protein
MNTAFEIDCRADFIEGMRVQLNEASEALARLPRTKTILYVNGLRNTMQIYCQANFVFQFGKPLKSCHSITYLQRERYIERLVEAARVEALVFADKPTFEWFMARPQYASYRSICSLLPNPKLDGPEFPPANGNGLWNAFRELLGIKKDSPANCETAAVKVIVPCTSCRTRLSLPAGRRGQVKCPRCAKTFEACT